MENETSVRRYILTINNPFWNKDNVEINVNDKLIDNNYLNLGYISDKKELFDFHYQYTSEKTEIYNRPYFKDVDCVVKYVEKLEHIKYSMFQVEKGINGTEHLQMFLIFTINKRFSTLKKYFPTAHFEEVKGTNVQCRDYCSKSDTRVSGPYEIGQFAEERSRTDIKSFIELIKSGADINTLFDLYPNLALKNFERIEKIRQQEKLQQVLKKGKKNMKVTYIYGPPGTGKTTWAIEQSGGYVNTFRVAKYMHGTFDDYNGQDNIIFDEFSGKFSIEDMNNYLDIHPCVLPARFANKVAMYTNVYIVSNLSLKELYTDIQQKHPYQYQAFLRRIHDVIRIDKLGMPPTYEKRTQEGVQLEMIDNSDLDELFGVNNK